jgi:hypothetical protein
MTQPPYGPNPENQQGPTHQDNTAAQRVEELYRLTQDILTKSATPYLPELGQLILRRGQLIDEVRLLNLQAYPQEEQNALLNLLLECKQMDQTIEQQMQTFRSNLDEQMRSLKEAKGLLHKYQIPDQGEMGTRSREA